MMNRPSGGGLHGQQQHRQAKHVLRLPHCVLFETKISSTHPSKRHDSGGEKPLFLSSIAEEDEDSGYSSLQRGRGGDQIRSHKNNKVVVVFDAEVQNEEKENHHDDGYLCQHEKKTPLPLGPKSNTTAQQQKHRRLAFRASANSSKWNLSFHKDPRKVMNDYLHRLVSDTNNKKKHHVALNKRGACYFYQDRFLIHLQVGPSTTTHGGNTGGNSYTMHTTVHQQLISGQANTMLHNEDIKNDDDDYFIEFFEFQKKVMELDDSLQQQSQNLSTVLSLRVKGGSNNNNKVQTHHPQVVNLHCTNQLAPSFEVFQRDMRGFVETAKKVKEVLKTTTTTTRLSL